MVIEAGVKDKFTNDNNVLGFGVRCGFVFAKQLTHQSYYLRLDLLVMSPYDSSIVDAGWSSLAARRAHNPKVVGSNPAPATNFCRKNNDSAMNGSLVLLA